MRFGQALRTTTLLLACVAFLGLSTFLTEAYILARLRGWGFGNATAEVDVAGTALLAGAMIVGIAASYIYQGIASVQSENIPIWKLIRQMPANRRFLTSMIVSPLVFNSVLAAIGDTGVTLAHGLLAFQNGFFWECIIGGPLQSRGPDPADPSTVATNPQGSRDAAETASPSSP
jgi:uncharacterized membrane protein YkvI